MELFEPNEILLAKTESEKKKRIIALSDLILRYQKSYYEGEGEISDYEFDLLWDELKNLDPKNPILQKIGSDISSNHLDSSIVDSISGNFQKVQHVMPMGSQEKAANPEEFMSWAKKHIYPEYLVEYKLDGASLELQYEKGVFKRAITRGDGQVGDDITDNAIKMNGVIKTLQINGDLQDFTGGIRGEVIMTHDVHKNFFSDKANCRNAANGLMKRKDGNGSEYLTLICYDCFSPSGFNFSDEEEKIKWLSDCGFNVVILHICKTAADVISYRAEVMERRSSLAYDIDGLVIKSRKIDINDMITRNRPDKQIAFKFSLEEAVTILRKVTWSESGATYTPIGEFDVVELAGTRVQKASLVNPNTISSLGVKIGSHIIVTKRGEIIPKIESVVKTENSEINATEIEFPKNCSVCGAKLKDEGTRLFCPNTSCKKRLHHQLEKWVSVLDIRDLGETLIKNLFDSEQIMRIRDFYSITEEELTPFFLTEESRAKDKKSLGAAKVIKAIHSQTELPLEVFIAGFDIDGIGETLVKKLILAGFDTLKKLQDATVSDIVDNVSGFAEILATNFVQGLVDNREEINYLIENNIITIKQQIAGGKLSGLSFCFTGELYSIKRSDAQKLVEQLGGSAKSSVVKGLSYLVTNDTSSGSSKNKRALELGIPVIDEKQFLELIK